MCKKLRHNGENQSFRYVITCPASPSLQRSVIKVFHQKFKTQFTQPFPPLFPRLASPPHSFPLNEIATLVRFRAKVSHRLSCSRGAAVAAGRRWKKGRDDETPTPRKHWDKMCKLNYFIRGGFLQLVRQARCSRRLGSFASPCGKESSRRRPLLHSPLDSLRCRALFTRLGRD